MWKKLHLFCQLLFAMLRMNSQVRFGAILENRRDRSVVCGLWSTQDGGHCIILEVQIRHKIPTTCCCPLSAPYFPSLCLLFESHHLTLCALLSCLAFISARRPLPIICNPGYLLPPWGLPLPSDPSQGSSMESGVLSSSERSELLL